MPYFMFFDLTVGLKEPLHVPKGTLKSILDHVAFVEKTLGFEKQQYKDNPPHWIMKPADSVTDKVLCETVEEHNRFVTSLWSRMEEWHTNPAEDGEVLTPEDAAAFWHGLRRIPAPPPERWTREYYASRMEHLYEVMRGQKSEGVFFGIKALNAKQAAAVIRLFSEFLDAHDMRLDVPKDCDHLASSYDGGYEWCEKCGAVTPEHADACRKRKCPLREEL